jgi:hypothetical protein
MFSKRGCFKDVLAWVVGIVASPAIPFPDRFGRGENKQALKNRHRDGCARLAW